MCAWSWWTIKWPVLWVVVSLSDVFCNISGTKYTSVMTRAPPKTHFLDDTAGTRARRHLKTYGGHLLNVLSKQVCFVSPPRPCECLYWFYACSASLETNIKNGHVHFWCLGARWHYRDYGLPPPPSFFYPCEHWFEPIITFYFKKLPWVNNSYMFISQL